MRVRWTTRGLAQERAALAAYLQSLSAVTPAQYAGWSKSQQYAFLANAYNAFTIEKILTRYPDLKSIRDFGTVIGNPWKDRFFTLLGKPQHLDGIEHEMMRAPGAFDDPRVHVAVNCASVGCPMLSNRAFTADKLDAQLDELFTRFMSDRSRNRYNAADPDGRAFAHFRLVRQGLRPGSQRLFFGERRRREVRRPARRCTGRSCATALRQSADPLSGVRLVAERRLR